jgi:hypothetical protein
MYDNYHNLGDYEDEMMGRSEEFISKEYPVPPLGIMPHKFWVERRVIDIVAAATRYRDAGFPIPKEWQEEYNDLIKEL